MTITFPVPVTLTQGTTANATDVMADLLSIQGDINSNAAHNGANSDITALSALTTPIAINQGGFGGTTAAAARTNLGVAASGSNSDITAITNASALAQIGGFTAGGFVNHFRNATMDIAIRGASGTLPANTLTYTVDGWIAAGVGASGIAWAQAEAAVPSAYFPYNTLKFTAASGVTDFNIRQRIESYIATPLASQITTITAWIYNNTGSSVTPTLTVNHANAQDNFSAVTADLSGVSLQACPAGAWTQVSYTYTGSAYAYLGLEVIFDFGGSMNASGGRFIWFAAPDMRYTPGLTVGLNSTPPTPELRPFENDLCRRYAVGFGNTGAVSLFPFYPQRSGTTVIDCLTPLQPIMRAAPSLITTSPTWNAGAPSGNQIAMYDNWATGYTTISGSPTFSLYTPTVQSTVIRLTATAFSGTTGASGNIYFGSSAGFILSSEL